MKTLFAILSIILLAGGLSADQIDLSGPWKFQVDMNNTGMDKGWQSPEFNASSWRTLQVPGTWESQGIAEVNPEWVQSDDLKQPYTGYAWYRRTVEIPSDWKGKNVFLNLGPIDDNDWTYFNGKMIGSTTQRVIQVSGIPRSYQVPADAIKFGGTNTIAVRVLDFRGLGGITRGPANLSNQVVQTSRGSNQNDSVQVGGSVTVQTNQTVNDAVAVWGNVTVMGHVQGDAVAVGGSVNLFPGSRVDGDVVAIGGKVNRQPGAIVGGQVTGIGPSFTIPTPHGPTSFPFSWPFLWPLWNPLAIFILVVASIFHVVISLIAAALFPDRVETIGSTVLEKPGITLLYGFVGYLVVLPLTLLLIVTCIGIPLVPVELVLLLAIKIMGRTGVGLAVGRKVGVGFNHPISSTISAVLVGALIIGFIQLIPLLGSLVALVLGMFGFGAVIMTGFGASSNWFANRRAGNTNQVAGHAEV
jgi:hypothetical protein